VNNRLGSNTAKIATMMKKENQSRAGNNSLLQTARTKNFGAGKFALISLKSKPQPPVKKVKVPFSLRNNGGVTNGKLIDDRSKVSDITASSGEEKDVMNRPAVIKDVQQNGKPNDNDIEVESSVLGMSINSGNSLEFSLSKAYIPGTRTTDIAGSGDCAGKKKNAVQSTIFSSLWPASTGAVNANHHHFKNKKFVKSQKAVKKEVTITKKKTMEISKGLRFSAPAPMTLNRHQPQMGQEKTAPESKEYLDMQEKRKKEEQKQIEAKHMAEAKSVIEERLKQAFELEEMGADLDDKFDNFDSENKNLDGNNIAKKKSLIKKLLGKVRPKPSKKWQQNQEKSSAIQAAMAAAAAAVEAAIENPSGLDESVSRPISEEEARVIVNQAMAVSRQKKKKNSTPELSAVMFHPSMINVDRSKMASQDIIASVDELGKLEQFPLNEVMIKPNEDSVSDLDASIRNMRKLPVAEVHMNDSKQCHGDESVSTLGTPRVFDQLDKLLLSQPHRLQQRPGLIHNFLEDNMGGSVAPPPMVTSHDARALIDQLDSGTMVGDATAGTAGVENAIQFCNIASNCFHPERNSLLMEASTRNHTIEGNTSAHGEERFDVGTSSSPTPAFTQAIDNAIRKAEIQIATNHTTYHKEDEYLPLTPIEEAGEMTSPIASLYDRNVAVRELKSPSASSRTIPTSFQMEIHPQPDHQTADFESFMNIAASKLDEVTETDKSCQDHYQHDRYSIAIDHNPRESNKDNGIKGHGKNINDTTPRTRGGVTKQFFGQKSSEPNFSDRQFDLLPAEKSGRNLMHDLTQLDKHLRTDEYNEKNTSKREKPYGKPMTGVVSARNEGIMMDQGRFLLEKDDAYWDTLSTIASTTNDRSSESDAYMDEYVQPGPIPGEITTTSSSEMKSVPTPIEAKKINRVIGNGISGQGALETNQHLEQGFLSRSEGNLNEMMNDVTDLIDADLLDKLPISKNKRSIDPISLEPGKDSDVIDKNKKSSTSNREIKMMSNLTRPSPETVDRSKFDEKKSGFAIAASHIAKGIRSVSWGIEEIYEDKNSHLDLSDQDTNNSEGSYSMTRRAQPCPEDMHRNQHTSLHSTGVQTREEEDLLSRTLELSKGLLETIMGSQLIQEKNKKEEKDVSSVDSRDMQNDKDHRNETLIECRDDFHNKEKTLFPQTSGNDFSPMIHSRLESLRNQRTRALSKFRQSQMPTSRSQKTEPVKRDRDRLKNYSFSHDYGKPSSNDRDRAKCSNYQHAIMKQSYSDDSEIELKYTTSDSDTSTAPSQKARDLRIQLDEAMRASREIQISQNQLGNELNSFKKKYYKNPEIQNYAS